MSRVTDLRAVDEALIAINRVQRSQRARQRIEDRSGVPLPPTAVATLAVVRQSGPVRPGTVAKRVGVQPSRLSREIRALIDAGFLEESPDPVDRRATLLETTPAGIDAHRRYRRAAEQTLAEVLGDWTDRDVTRLAELLTRLAGTFNSIPEG